MISVDIVENTFKSLSESFVSRWACGTSSKGFIVSDRTWVWCYRYWVIKSCFLFFILLNCSVINRSRIKTLVRYTDICFRLNLEAQSDSKTISYSLFFCWLLFNWLSSAGCCSHDWSPKKRPVFWGWWEKTHGHQAISNQIPWLLFFMGCCIYLLVSSDGNLMGPFVWLFLQRYGYQVW